MASDDIWILGITMTKFGLDAREVRAERQRNPDRD